MSNNILNTRSERNKFIIKTEIFVIIGYFIVTVETMIAKILGLIEMSFSDIILLGIIVIGGTFFCLFINLFKKSISNNLEKVLFAAQISLYIILFSIWVYHLAEIRPFALFSTLFAIIVVIFYTNFIQSLIISVSTVISFIAISYYAETIARQSVNFIQDMFYAFCFIPISIFFSISANQATKKNKELESAKQSLEEKNNQLLMLNCQLEQTQKMARIELDLANDIQKSLLPEQPIATKSWDIAMSFKPRYGISGDFYDFYYEEEKLNGLSLFDVSGHGIASALITILAKPVLHKFFNLVKNDPLGRMIELTNNTLKKDLNAINMFITGIIFRFNNNEIEYINAGHPDPLYKNKNTGKVSLLTAISSDNKTTPIGIQDLVNFRSSAKFSIKPGDVLLLYTDCLTESHDLKKSRYGYERLKQSLEEAPDAGAQEILDYILHRFYSFLNEKEIEDDFTTILIKRLN